MYAAQSCHGPLGGRARAIKVLDRNISGQLDSHDS